MTTQDLTQQQRVAQFADRRREPRDNQPAPVRVRIEQSGREEEFQAVMVDSSHGGLAIRHWRKNLGKGELVRVLLSRGEFTARIVWNWSVGPVVISGLQKAQPGALLRIDTRRPMNQLASARNKILFSWMVAAFTGLAVLVVGWYFKAKIW